MREKAKKLIKAIRFSSYIKILFPIIFNITFKFYSQIRTLTTFLTLACFTKIIGGLLADCLLSIFIY
jgi:hypothetical protein